MYIWKEHNFVFRSVRLIVIYQSVANFEPCNVTEMQGETQHFGDLGDEPVARSKTAGDRGLG